MKRILFVCIENSCRSQMAEGLARHLGGGGVEVWSAGSRPSGRLNPRAIRFMTEAGIDLTGQRSKGLGEVEGRAFDAVVGLGCGEACPHIPARLRLEWEIPDPSDIPDQHFRVVRDLIRRRVHELLKELAPTDV